MKLKSFESDGLKIEQALMSIYGLKYATYM